MSRLLALYPRPWRQRYGDELLALLEARPPDAGDRVDILRGAIDARLHPELLPGPGGERLRPYVAVRRLGAMTIAVSPLWLLTWWLAATGPVVSDGGTTYVDGSAGLLPLIVATSLLALSLAVHLARMPGRAALARAGGTVAAAGLLLWAMAPWMWPILLAAVAGLVVFAIGAWQSGAWSRAAATTLAVAAAGPVLPVAAAAIAVGDATRTSPLAIAMAAIAVGLATIAWLVVGAVHLGAVEPDPGPGPMAMAA